MTDSDKGYIQRDIGGSWLTGGHANVCILKLNPPTEDEFKNDGSRSINISMITRLLDATTSDGDLLQKEFPGQPTIVLAPELAFGSTDFDIIDSLINNYCHNLIFICGFGFTSGSALNDLITRTNANGVWHTPPSDKFLAESQLVLSAKTSGNFINSLLKFRWRKRFERQPLVFHFAP